MGKYGSFKTLAHWERVFSPKGYGQISWNIMTYPCVVGELHTDVCWGLYSDEMSWILLCKSWRWLHRTNMLHFIEQSCGIHRATWCYVFWEIVCENMEWRPTSLPPKVFVLNCPLIMLIAYVGHMIGMAQWSWCANVRYDSLCGSKVPHQMPDWLFIRSLQSISRV